MSHLLLEKNISELVKTLLAHHPLRGLQRAARETFPAARGVAQSDGIGRRIESDLVRAGDGARRDSMRRRLARVARRASSHRPASAAFPKARLSWSSDGSPRPMRRIPVRSPAAARLRPRGGRTRSRRWNNWDSRPGRCRGASTTALFTARSARASRLCRPPGSRPAPKSARHFPTTAAGMEKSIATSMPRKFSAVMPSKSALLNSSSFSATSKPYSGARLLDQLAHLAVADDGQAIRRHCGSIHSKTSGSSSREEFACAALRRLRAGPLPPPRGSDSAATRLARSCGC